MRTEPVIVYTAGGTAIVQIVMALLVSYGVEITPTQQALWTSLTTAIFALIARQQVTPVASLPPGVAGDIADAKAAKAAER